MATRPQPKKAGASRPQLRVVRGNGQPKRWSPIPIIVCVVLTVFGVTALQASMGANGLKSAKLEKQVQQESERNVLLRARVAQLSNPGRVADEAKKLGLVQNPDVGHVRVETDHPDAFRTPPPDTAPIPRDEP